MSLASGPTPASERDQYTFSDFVCLCVSAIRLREKRLELPTLNLVYLLYGNRSPCIDPQVERSEIEVTVIKCSADVGMHVDVTA